MRIVFMCIAALILIAACTQSTKKDIMPPADNSQARETSLPSGFEHHNQNINNNAIHFVSGGRGPVLVLLHGFGENWYVWNRILPTLSQHFTLIIPDLPGMDGAKQTDRRFDKKNMASEIHALLTQLGQRNIYLAGHDIGMMVAYAYAAQYPEEVKRLALLDAPIPGVEPYWSKIKSNAWWFGFFSWPAAPGIIKGRENIFLDNFWIAHSEHPEVFNKSEKLEFLNAYSRGNALYNSFQWFAAFQQDENDNRLFAKQKLKMPVLALGGEFAAAATLYKQAKQVTVNVRRADIRGAKHWILQEGTEQVQAALLNFFTDKQTNHE